MKKLTYAFCSLVFSFCFLNSNAVSAAKYEEYQIKAVFIYKLTKFIRWQSADEGIKICIFDEASDGDDDIEGALGKIIQKSKKNIVLERGTLLKDLDSCNLVFMSDISTALMKNILSQISGKPVVTVSDMNGFTRRGGMFGFTRADDGRINLELNYKNAKKNGVDIRSTLLEMIKIVRRNGMFYALN